MTPDFEENLPSELGFANFMLWQLYLVYRRAVFENPTCVVIPGKPALYLLPLAGD